MGVIHESPIRVSVTRTAFLEIEGCPKTFSSVCQGYEELEAKLAKALNILFIDLRT